MQKQKKLVNLVNDSGDRCHFVTFRCKTENSARMNPFCIVNTREELDAQAQYLVNKAEEVLAQSYAPYSRFSVAAALLLENNEVVTGTNQENAAYPSGMCAERVALFAKASRYPGIAVKKLAVVARNGDKANLSAATCCGACRQVMLEFERRQSNPFEIIMLNQDSRWIIAASAASLLPFSFTAQNLGLAADSI